MPRPSKFDSVEKAKEYILAHPDESKLQQSVGSGFAERTIARARAELIHEGKLAPSRKKAESPPSPPASEAEPPRPPAPESTAPGPAPTGGLLDSQAMKALSDLIDEAASEADDATVHKRLLKQCLLFAFDTRLHPDTRMSASQMWSKLKDQTQARALGPGKPKTFDEAVERMSAMMEAVGAEITLAAVNRTFNVQEPADAGKLPTDTPEDAQGAPPTSGTPGGSSPVSEAGK